MKIEFTENDALTVFTALKNYRESLEVILEKHGDPVKHADVTRALNNQSKDAERLADMVMAEIANNR